MEKEISNKKAAHKKNSQRAILETVDPSQEALENQILAQHINKINTLQQQLYTSASLPLALYLGEGHSNTTRSKIYKRGAVHLDCSQLDQILSIDPVHKKILVEPRVTMEALVQATLTKGLLPCVVPEFKGITVGGAIMGCAAESTSHKWGIFHDSCTQLTFLNGRGELIRASPKENADLFYGISGSYGTLGLLVSVELNLVPAGQAVHLTYHVFSNPQRALKTLQNLAQSADFVDGIVFSKDHSVIIEGKMVNDFACKPKSTWFAHKIKTNQGEKLLPLYDYLFRYDQGAFWMGNFVFSLPFLARYLLEGLLKIGSDKEKFSEKEIQKFLKISFPSNFSCLVFKPLMSSQRLWKLLHMAEKWIQDRLIIQDFCIPESQASSFLSSILQHPATFPIWLCPIKGTHTPQFLAPHLGHGALVNFGVYGLPATSAPMRQIIQSLEQNTHACGGRKVLYSRSYYDTDHFWHIYSKPLYDTLRKKTHAEGIWRELTEKVLSE